MKNNKNKRQKKSFVKFYPGELVEVKQAGYYSLWETWAKENGYAVPPVRNIPSKAIGKFIKTSPSNGPLYKIIDFNGELFEIIHASLKKIIVKNNNEK